MPTTAIWWSILTAGVAAQPGVGTLSTDEPADVHSAARMTEMAERFAGVDAEQARRDAVATPKPRVAPIESTPLGQAAPRAASPNGEDASTPGDGGGSWGPSGILSTLTALGVVVGLIFLVRWLVAKASGTPIATTSSAVEVLSRSSVAPRSHVLLLRVGQRVLVVGESSGGLRTLGEVTDEAEVATLLQAVESAKPQSIAGGFGSLLHKFNRPYEQNADGDAFLGLGQPNDSEARVDRARDSLSSLVSRLKQRSGGGNTA